MFDEVLLKKNTFLDTMMSMLHSHMLDLYQL